MPKKWVVSQGVIHKIRHGKFGDFDPLPPSSRLRHDGPDPLPPSSRVTKILPSFILFLTIIKTKFGHPGISKFDRLKYRKQLLK